MRKEKANALNWFKPKNVSIDDLKTGKVKEFMTDKGYAVTIDKTPGVYKTSKYIKHYGYKISWWAQPRYLHNNKIEKIDITYMTNIKQPIIRYYEYLASYMDDNNEYEIICYTDDYEEISFPISNEKDNKVLFDKISKYIKFGEEYGKDCYIKVMDVPYICNPYHDFDNNPKIKMKIEILRIVYDIKIDDPEWYKHLIFGYCRIYSENNFMPKDLKCLCLSFIGSLVDSGMEQPWIYM